MNVASTVSRVALIEWTLPDKSAVFVERNTAQRTIGIGVALLRKTAVLAQFSIRLRTSAIAAMGSVSNAPISFTLLQA